jgi:nucleoside-diphosphate-sugar epimerase
MRILVTGACGLIGQSVVREFLAHGHDVVALDVQLARERLPADDHLSLFRADVSELGDLLAIVAEGHIERIVHLGYILPPESERQPRLALRVNTQGTSNVFEVARLVGVQRVVYASSVAVYGDQANFGERPVVESDTGSPMNLYGATKLLNDIAAIRFAATYGLDVVGLRIATVFGYGRETGNSAWIGKIASYPGVGQVAHCPLPSWQRSAMIYVDDVASLLVRLCVAPVLRHRMYLSGGDTCSLAELADLVRSIVPNADITFDDSGPDFPHVYLVDETRLRQEIDYQRPPLRDRIVDQINVARAAAGLLPVGTFTTPSR